LIDLWMLVPKLTRIQPLLSQFRRYRLSSYHVSPYQAAQRFQSPLTRLLSMAHPVASSSHPAQIPALDSPHANEAKKSKEAKEKKTKGPDVSAFPLEVHLICLTSRFLTAEFLHSYNLDQPSWIIVSRYLRNSKQSTMSLSRVSLYSWIH
jgi:hypothetical protein